MDSELLRIFNDEHEPIGEATREEVHAKGFWHETFHCWLVSKIEDKYYLYFQLRSAYKKDYASQFDITAAGHLLANERAQDGFRELQEELGLPLTVDDMKKIGVFETRIQQPPMIDLEFAHVYYVFTLKDFNYKRKKLLVLLEQSLVQCGISTQVSVKLYMSRGLKSSKMERRYLL